LQKNLTCLFLDPRLGQYLMMVGILMLLFIGFKKLLFIAAAVVSAGNRDRVELRAKLR